MPNIVVYEWYEEKKVSTHDYPFNYSYPAFIEYKIKE